MLELSFTAWDLAAFARDLGWAGAIASPGLYERRVDSSPWGIARATIRARSVPPRVGPQSGCPRSEGPMTLSLPSSCSSCTASNRCMMTRLPRTSPGPERLYFNIERMGHLLGELSAGALRRRPRPCDRSADAGVHPRVGAGAMRGYLVMRFDPAVVGVKFQIRRRTTLKPLFRLTGGLRYNGSVAGVGTRGRGRTWATYTA
jgi:hypothetical protein